MLFVFIVLGLLWLWFYDWLFVIGLVNSNVDDILCVFVILLYWEENANGLFDVCLLILVVCGLWLCLCVWVCVLCLCF